jgi:phosphoribosylformylglycinamidine synthase subunit PurL
MILGNSVVTPGGDAGIVRIENGPKGLAMTTDVTPRYCEADPFEGGKQAVAEAWRNLVAVGATPLAVTDNLNFGNPERPEIMGQFVGCLNGIGEACRALDFPIVSGNVSLYNETNGKGIPPTPAIGGVGLLADVTKHATVAFKAAGETIILIGETQGWLGQSIWLRDVCGREEGAPPPVDLITERKNGEWVRAQIEAGRLNTVHDLSDGGLALTLAEMALAGNIGATITALPDGPIHAILFGEDQARYVLTCPPDKANALLAEARQTGVPAQLIGTTGGETLTLPGEAPISITDMRKAHESWFPAYMSGKI